MALLNILHFPDPRLRQKCLPVSQFDADLQKLVDDMFETMYDALGIGLAAMQVNILKRVVVIDVSEDKSAPHAYINPEVIWADGVEVMQEGCLSVPDFFEEVERAERVKVRYCDTRGNVHEVALDGLEAVCIQHEIDHLNGKLFVDYISPLKRNRIQKKLEKLKKLGRIA